MKIRSVEVEGFQGYDDEMVTFPEGTTFISGPIGSGKSTLLRAIFCGLFQTDAYKVMPDVGSLDELVGFGAQRASVRLIWEVNGDIWESYWELEVDGVGDNRSASTAECSLNGGWLDDGVSGVRDVQEVIQSEVIQMDAESFVSSVYVQQKEMRRLLDASPSQRQEILDGLLGLDSIDRYRDRMERARPAATRARDDADARIEEISSQISELRDLEDLRDERENLESEISDLADEIREQEEKKNKLEEDKEDLVEQQESISDLQSEREELRTEIETLQGRIEDTQAKISEWKSEKQKLQEENDSFDPLSEDLDPDQLEDLQDRRDDLKDQLTRHRTELESLETHLEPEEVEERIQELQGYITRPVSEVETELEGARDQRETELRDLDAQIERVEVQLSQIGKIEETGECPVCERSVDDHRDESELESRLSELESRRDQREAELDSQISQLKQELEKQEALQEDLEAAQEKLGTVREDRTAAKEHTEEIERLEDELPVVESKIEEIEEFIDNQKTREANESRIGELEGMIDDHESQLSQMRSDVESKQDRISEIESEIPEDIDYETKISRLEAEKLLLESEIEDNTERREDLKDQLRDVEGEISQHRELIERRETAQSRREEAQEIRDEIESVLDLYEEVKERLRRENIKLLNKYVNDLFGDLYQDQNYDRIEIGSDWDIQMVRSSGHRMSPSLASGGERAILNLALRAAVYRLVSEKEARIGQLPPFILDEPTQGMDAEHVRQLGRLTEKIRSWDVAQLFIVSHESDVNDLCDHRIDVVIDPGSDTSSAEITTS